MQKNNWKNMVLLKLLDLVRIQELKINIDLLVNGKQLYYQKRKKGKRI